MLGKEDLIKLKNLPRNVKELIDNLISKTNKHENDINDINSDLDNFKNKMENVEHEDLIKLKNLPENTTETLNNIKIKTDKHENDLECINISIEDIRNKVNDHIDNHPTGGGGGKNIIAKYVHNSNKIIRPSSVELQSGIFTCNNHGLVTGDILIISTSLLSSVPFEIFSANVHALNPMTANVINENTFSLKLAGKILTFENSANTNIDVNRFHFEKTKYINSIKFDKLNLTDFDIYIYGEVFCHPYKPYMYFYKNKNKILDKYGCNFNTNLVFPSNSITTPFNYKYSVKDKSIEIDLNFYTYKTTVSDYNYINHYPTLYFNRCTMQMGREIKFMGDDHQGSIDCCSLETSCYFITNGTTIEIHG